MRFPFFKRQVCLSMLKKLPKTVLVVDRYNKIAEQEKERLKFLVPGVDIDFEERGSHYSLIIFCNIAFRLHLRNPLSLACGEIWFTRNFFSEAILADALEYYSNCEIRNGL